MNLENEYSEFIANEIISESEFQIVSELHFEFKKFNERNEKRNLSDKNILKDIKWINIMNIGLKAWTELKNKTESPRDKKIMDELEIEYLNERTPPNNV